MMILTAKTYGKFDALVVEQHKQIAVFRATYSMRQHKNFKDHHHHHMVFLEWPKQQRHHEDHYSQSKYEQYQTVLYQQLNKYVFKWRRKVDTNCVYQWKIVETSSCICDLKKLSWPRYFERLIEFTSLV